MTFCRDAQPPCRLLLAGFEPWGTVVRNPSGRMASDLGRSRELRRAGLVTAVLPVHLIRAKAALARLLREHRPEALLLTGVAVDRAEICLEEQAANLYCPAARPGARRPLLTGGPARLRVTLPLEPLEEAVKRVGTPVRRSDDAGTFLCNAVLYHALSWARAGDPRRPAPRLVGFAHLPATPGTCQLARPAAPNPLPLSQLRESVRALAQVLLLG